MIFSLSESIRTNGCVRERIIFCSIFRDTQNYHSEIDYCIEIGEDYIAFLIRMRYKVSGFYRMGNGELGMGDVPRQYEKRYRKE